MEKLTKECVLQSAARLEQESQDAVMRDIPQFFEAEIVTRFAGAVPQKKELNPLVFNMERGICLAETVDFLRECPALRPYDLILANELDSGCARSGERDTAAEIARALGMQYVFGLEFVELKDAAHGFHGNAIFSRWPILWAEVLRLPEQYNWYYDRQKRIGGRNAVFAKLDVQGQEVGAVSIHLENRTSGAGRLQQMKAVLQEVERVFPGIPVVLGGDLNTNTFDGRDKAVIRHLCDEPEELAAAIEMIDRYEPLLQDCTAAGYAWREASGGADCTRRKPLPEGGCLHMKLDWLLPRGFTVHCSSVISTLTADCGFAAPDSALARYYYLPRQEWSELFDCSLKGIYQVRSSPDGWNLQMDFYRTEVLSAMGADNVTAFVYGVLSLGEALDAMNAEGRLETVELNETNQSFLTLCRSVKEQGISGQDAYTILSMLAQSGEGETEDAAQ